MMLPGRFLQILPVATILENHPFACCFLTATLLTASLFIKTTVPG